MLVPDPSTDTAARRGSPSALPGVGSTLELLGLLGLPDDLAKGRTWTLPVPVQRVRLDGVLLHEGSQGDTLYVVRSGSFKRVRTLEDGYEQVLTLAFPGELLGFEVLHAGCRHSSAVALEDSTVYAMSIPKIDGSQACCPMLEEAMRIGLSRQLVRAAETAEMMAAVASDARLARFILWLSTRMAEVGQSPRRLRLRMGRGDIASLLGLAHETISRSFTMLAEQGCLRVDNREIEILDIDLLRARARCTRGLSAEPAQRRTAPRPPKPAVSNGWWSGSPARIAA